jgi:hypothetical protein
VFEKTAQTGTVEQIVREGRKVDVLALSVNKRHYADSARKSRNHEIFSPKNVCSLDPATILLLPLSLHIPVLVVVPITRVSNSAVSSLHFIIIITITNRKSRLQRLLCFTNLDWPPAMQPYAMHNHAAGPQAPPTTSFRMPVRTLSSDPALSTPRITK